MTPENPRTIDRLKRTRGAAVYGLIGLSLLYTVTDRVSTFVNNFNAQSARFREGTSFHPYATPSGYRLSVVHTEGRRPISCGDGRPVGYTQIVSREIIFVMEKGERPMIIPPEMSQAIPPGAACNP